MTSTASSYGLVTEDSSADMFKGTKSVTAAELPHPTTDSNVTGENTQHSVSVIQTTIYAVIGVVSTFLKKWSVVDKTRGKGIYGSYCGTFHPSNVAWKRFFITFL